MAAKWKYIVIDEEGKVHGTDSKDELLQLCRDTLDELVILEVSEDGVFQLDYTAVEEELDEEGIEVEAEVEEELSRMEIEEL